IIEFSSESSQTKEPLYFKYVSEYVDSFNFQPGKYYIKYSITIPKRSGSFGIDSDGTIYLKGWWFPTILLKRVSAVREEFYLPGILYTFIFKNPGSGNIYISGKIVKDGKIAIINSHLPPSLLVIKPRNKVEKEINNISVHFIGFKKKEINLLSDTIESASEYFNKVTGQKPSEDLVFLKSNVQNDLLDSGDNILFFSKLFLKVPKTLYRFHQLALVRELFKIWLPKYLNNVEPGIEAEFLSEFLYESYAEEEYGDIPDLEGFIKKINIFEPDSSLATYSGSELSNVYAKKFRLENQIDLIRNPGLLFSKFTSGVIVKKRCENTADKDALKNEVRKFLNNERDNDIFNYLSEAFEVEWFFIQQKQSGKQKINYKLERFWTDEKNNELHVIIKRSARIREKVEVKVRTNKRFIEQSFFNSQTETELIFQLDKKEFLKEIILDPNKKLIDEKSYDNRFPHKMFFRLHKFDFNYSPDQELDYRIQFSLGIAGFKRSIFQFDFFEDYSKTGFSGAFKYHLTGKKHYLDVLLTLQPKYQVIKKSEEEDREWDISAVNVELNLSTLNDSKNPTRGNSLLLGYETGSDKIHENLSYSRYKLESKYFFRLTQRHILGVRIFGEKITGAFPQNYLLTLGGLHNLKSYYESDVLGREKVLLNIEDRFLAFNNIGWLFLWITTLNKIQLVTGYELGRFTDANNDLESDVYFGIRFHMLTLGVKPFIFSFDFSGERTYFSMNHTF
ncbi:BamA/TamA family outer membrane protein, partial [Candidatus Dependentiae bacterium]|nr:BamA/TamA family outer membrane protein [Candidatus Dependentiae bacterium]